MEGLNLIAGKRLFFTNKVVLFADRLVRTVQHLRTNSNVARSIDFFPQPQELDSTTHVQRYYFFNVYVLHSNDPVPVG